MNKHLVIAAKCSVTVALLIWLFYNADWAALTTSLRQVSVTILLAGLTLYLFAQLISSARWYLICRALHLSTSLFALVNLYFLGMFFNLFLPTGIGGDVVKSYHLGKSQQRHLLAAYSVLFDRISGLLALIWLAVIAMHWVRIDLPWLKETAYAVGIFSLAAVALLPQLIELLSRLVPALEKYLRPLTALYRHPLMLMLLLLLAVVIQVTGVAVVVLIGHQLDITLSPAIFTVSWALINLATLLPVSINGLGVREFGFVVLFRGYGVADEQSLALGLLTFIIPAMASLLGIIPLLRHRLTPPKNTTG